MAQNGRYIIGIDTGGTFTDITVLTSNGEVFIDKAPTTPRDFSKGVMDAIAKVAEDMGLTSRDVLRKCEMFKHGTTVATNALITRTGSKVGLITTGGFEDTTIMMRAIGRVAGLSEDELKHQATAIKPVPLVPRQLIKGVTERIDFRGNVVIPINVDEAREAVRSLIEDHGVEAIAVNFLWGFVNPVHEQKVRSLIQQMYPRADIFVCCASELCPVVREYARSNTVITNAFLGKTMETYIGGLIQKLQGAGYDRPPLIMQANGGAVHREEMAPIGTIGSGPSGGITASKYIADQMGHSHVITTDMGGTSFDVGLIVDGFWRYMREPVVERFHITWPMIDIQSIGAGGGTIAWIDPTTRGLRLGPMSAAAAPGPVCYDTGGTEPTVTDADLVLGLLDPNYFLGGRMKLNKAKAEEAIREKIATPLGLDLTEAASAIYQVINGHMSDLIRKQVVTTGHAPEEFVVYSFGGAGPVHAAAYAAELGVEDIYVFPTSAVFSSFGVATADVIRTFTSSYRYMMPVDPQVLNARLRDIEDRLYSSMLREGFKRQEVSFRRTFYMRYRRQLNELDLKVPTKEFDEADVESIMRAFDRRYEEVYGEGSAYSEAGIELISISVDAIGTTRKPVLRTYAKGETQPDRDALKGRREVFFPEAHSFLNTRIYDYQKLRPGNVVEGPAIVETPITTIVIPPGILAQADIYLNVKISTRG